MLAHMGTSLFVTIAVMTVIVAITAGLFARGRSMRALFAGIGCALIPLALYLTGLTTLMANGISSLIAWFNQATWDSATSWGASLGGLGIVLIVISRFLRKQETSAKPKPAAPSPKERPGVTAGTPKASASAPSQPKGRPTQPAPADDDLDEIEAILKKRGIN